MIPRTCETCWEIQSNWHSCTLEDTRHPKMQSRAIWYLKHSRQVSNVVSTQLHRTTTILCAERLNRVSTFEQCRSRGSSQQSEIVVQATHNLWTSYVMPSRRELEYNTVTVLDALCHRLPHYKHGSSMRNGFRIRTAQELLMADNAKRAKEPKRSTEIQTRIKNQKIKRHIRTGSNILMDQRDVKWQSDWCDLSARLGQTWWQSPPSCLDLEKQTKKFSRLDFVMCWSSDSISVKPSLACIHILISRN